MVNTPGCEPGIRQFDPDYSPHNRIHTLIQSGICEKPQKCSEMGIFSYLLVAYHLIYLIFRAYLLQSFWT